MCPLAILPHFPIVTPTPLQTPWSTVKIFESRFVSSYIRHLTVHILLRDTHCSMHHCFFFLLCQIIVCCTYVPCLVHVNGYCYFFLFIMKNVMNLSLDMSFVWTRVLFETMELLVPHRSRTARLYGNSVLVIWGTAKHVSKMGPIFSLTSSVLQVLGFCISPAILTVFSTPVIM